MSDLQAEAQPQSVGDGEPSTGNMASEYLVMEFKLHNPPRWLRELIAHLQLTASLCVAETLDRLKSSLRIERMADGKRIQRATLELELSDSLRDRISNLLDPARIAGKTKEGQPERRVTNSYGFITMRDGELGSNTVVATVRLLERVPIDKLGRDGLPLYRKEAINVTLGLQQLIASFMKPARLLALPTELRNGVAQEIAQQIMSHVQLDDSGEVEQANFPTVESRHPGQRQQSYLDSLDRSCRRTTPFERKPYSEVNHERFARIAKQDPLLADKLEKREVIVDSDWDNVRRTPFPPQTPLLIATSDAAQIFAGEKQVEAGISKADMCRGVDKLEAARLKVRKPDKVMERGYTTIRPYFVALPLINPDDEGTKSILVNRDQRRQGKRRGWDFKLCSLPMWGDEPYRPTVGKRGKGTQRVLVPIEFGQEYQLQRLRHPMVEPCWSRLVRRDDEFVWQLTYKMSVPVISEPTRVLGVHLGIDYIISWALLDESGRLMEQDQIKDNPVMAVHQRATRAREVNQRAGRWVGGRTHADQLETIAYQLVHQLLGLARDKQAWLSVEKIEWVDKKGHRAADNLRFSGWNYGQLRRFLDYKAPLVGQPVPYEVPQFVMDLTCPHCGAIRQKGQKKDDANTWLDLKTRILTCRKCGVSGPISGHDQAAIAARAALAYKRDKGHA